MSKVLDIIRNEHRSIRVVLDGLLYLAENAKRGSTAVDARVFRALLHYLETYAERLHHPKEDRYLFAAMRQYGPRAESVVAGLEAEHTAGERTLRDLDHYLARCEEGGGKALPAFAKAAEDFVRGYLLHMKKEEDEVFPLALELLGPADWAVIDRAFEENHDTLAGVGDAQDLKQALNRIVKLASAPGGNS
jgi:hemerythrin-like domain-containing protein